MFHDFVPCSSPAGCGSSDFSRHTIALHAAPCNIVDPESCICHYMLHRSVLGSFPSGGREDKKWCYFRAKHARQRCKTKFVHWELDLVLADICFMILRSRDEWTCPTRVRSKVLDKFGSLGTRTSCGWVWTQICEPAEPNFSQVCSSLLRNLMNFFLCFLCKCDTFIQCIHGRFFFPVNTVNYYILLLNIKYVWIVIQLLSRYSWELHLEMLFIFSHKLYPVYDTV